MEVNTTEIESLWIEVIFICKVFNEAWLSAQYGLHFIDLKTVFLTIYFPFRYSEQID